MKPAIIVHGGAKTMADDKANDKAKANIDGCLAAAEAGWAILQQGDSAKDAVERLPHPISVAQKILEDRSQDMAVAYRTVEMEQAAVFTKKEANQCAVS